MTAFACDTERTSEAQDAEPIGVHAKRIIARIAINAGYVRALEIDPSLSVDQILRLAMEDNCDQISEEMGA